MSYILKPLNRSRNRKGDGNFWAILIFTVTDYGGRYINLRIRRNVTNINAFTLLYFIAKLQGNFDNHFEEYHKYHREDIIILLRRRKISYIQHQIALQV